MRRNDDEFQAGDILHATVEGEDRRRYPGRVYELTSTGANVFFARPGVPACRVGETLDVEFSADLLRKPMLVPSMVHLRTEVSGGRRYEFAFVDWRDFWGQVPSKLQSLLNQRGAIRMRPENPVDVQIAVDATEKGVAGRLFDISASGLALVVPQRAEEIIGEAEDLTLSFYLPSCEQRLKVGARIRHRRMDNEGVMYGIAFERGPRFPVTAEQAIRRYIEDRAREIARAR